MALPKNGGKSASGTGLNTRVSQLTIDNIKKIGMSAALKKAAASKDPSFVEGVKRMYGANRLAAARKTTSSTAKSPDQARGINVGSNKPATKSTNNTTTVYNRLTGQKVTYPTQTSKPKASAPTVADKPIYNRLTGEKIDYTPSKVKSKASTPKPKPVAPKYNRLTGEKLK